MTPTPEHARYIIQQSALRPMTRAEQSALSRYVDSLTRERDAAIKAVDALRHGYVEDTSDLRAALARVGALWADNAVKGEGGGSYISPGELRAAIDGPALAVTASPETPEHAVTCEPFQACTCGATPEED